MQTTCELQEYKGYPVIAFFRANEDGSRDDRYGYPYLSIGRSKLKIILEHWDEIQEILESLDAED